MVAGGGASVIYSDTICDLGGASELANYGEYSGAPSEQQTYEYAKTILSLMTQEKHPDGKVSARQRCAIACVPTAIKRGRINAPPFAGPDLGWRYRQLHKRCCYLQRYRHSSPRVPA